MKLISFLILFTIFGVLAASDCGCKENCRRKIKVQEEKDPEIKVIYTGTPCACQKALPFRVEKPVVPKYKLRKHKYNVEIKEEESEPDCRYIFNTKVEKPKIEKVKLNKYPVRVEELLEQCKHHPRFIYSVKVEKPEEKCETQLDGLVAKVDKIVVPIEDCLQPCCHPSKSSEETPKNKIKKCDSSEEILTDSSEEICTKSKKYRTVPRKVKGCPKCEALDSDEGCGCNVQSSEEILTDSSEEICTKTKKYKKVPKKVQGCPKCEALDSCEGCGCYIQSSEEILTGSSEEICTKTKKYSKVPRKVQGCSKCEALDSDEGCGCIIESSEEEKFHHVEVQTSKVKCDISSEEYIQESSEETPKPCLETEEVVEKISSEESPEVWEYCKCCNKNCQNKKPKYEESKECEKSESSDEIQTQSSEECSEKCSPKKHIKCDSSEEIRTKSSEESCDDSGEVYEEEYCCKGKPVTVPKQRKHSRYSNDDCGKRFSRYKRELFLDDMHDFSVYTEQMTRNEIQKTIAQLRANSTISKRRRKGKKRQKNKLVQNNDQFEDHNKFIQDDDDLIVNGRGVLDNPKDLQLDYDLKQMEERGKRHLECGTIERLKKKPRYDMDVLADAGCSQYIPEIIRQDQEYLDYMNNRNKRHLSTYDGNANFPVKMVDATRRTNPHHYHWKKIQYRRHHHPVKSEKSEEISEKQVDPKFYYKYLSLTAPGLSTTQIKTKTNEEDAPEDKKIVYDHLGHKFLEFNGFRTLIKPKIEYVDDSSYEKPKFWTCKEDLINPEDFGKVTTISADTPINTLTTEEPVTKADLQEHEFNLCEYLKNLEETKNFTAQQNAKNAFLHNCEEYIKFLVYNPSEDDKTNITETTANYLENLLLNTHLKNHIRKLFHTKHKFENKLAEITKLLHKPKVVENFKNYLLFKNEFDAIKNQVNLTDYTILHFYVDVNLVLNQNTTTETPLN